MSSFSDFLKNKALTDNFVTPTVHLALFTVAPTDAGGGTEVTGGGYARQTIPFGTASGGAITTTAPVSFTASGAAFGTVVAIGIFDAGTAGNMLAWDDITSATIGDGDTISFAAGDIDISLT